MKPTIDGWHELNKRHCEFFRFKPNVGVQRLAKCTCLLSEVVSFWVSNSSLKKFGSSWTLLSMILKSPHKDKEMRDIGFDRSLSNKLYCQRERGALMFGPAG